MTPEERATRDKIAKRRRKRAALDARGLLNPDGIRRAVAARGCPKCYAEILVGLDGDICALVSRVDPVPISASGEAVATLQGRRTYALRRRGGRMELHPRTDIEIRRSPPGARDYDVVADHACGAPPLPSLPTVNAPRTKTDDPDDPPF